MIGLVQFSKISFIHFILLHTRILKTCDIESLPNIIHDLEGIVAVDPVEVANGDRREVHLILRSYVSSCYDRILPIFKHNIKEPIHSEVTQYSEDDQPDGGPHQ